MGLDPGQGSPPSKTRLQKNRAPTPQKKCWELFNHFSPEHFQWFNKRSYIQILISALSQCRKCRDSCVLGAKKVLKSTISSPSAWERF